MAGEVESYNFPISFEIDSAKEIAYHDNLMSGDTMISMDSYLSDKLNEDALLNLLLSDGSKAEALELLEKHVEDNHGLLMFHEKLSLFKGFASVLADSNEMLKCSCTKIIIKIIPQLGSDLAAYMSKVLHLLIGNIGAKTALQKESIQALHVYMSHSLNVDPILKAIACDGIKHKDARVRQKIIVSFPTLLFPEFQDDDFFDIVQSLVENLNENVVDRQLVLNALDRVSRYIGRSSFSKCIDRLSTTLQQSYNNCSSDNVDNLILTKKASDRLALHTKDANAISDIDSESANDNQPSTINLGYKDLATMSARRRRHLNASSNTLVDSLSIAKNVNIQNDSSYSFKLSFVPKDIIEQLVSPEHTIRLKALKSFKDVLFSLKEPTVVKENVVPLMSLLQSSINDKNFRVASSALQVVNVLISMMGSDLHKYSKLFVNAVSRKLGSAKDSVKTEYYKVLQNTMEIVGPQKVLDLLSDKLTHKPSKVREDCLCIIIATLLRSLKSRNYADLDFNEICSKVANCLTDDQPIVRKAALDCIAVLGCILGNTSREILSAVDKVELRHENASGIMSAVQARLLKHQLPQLNENMLVEYAVYPPSTAPVGSLQGSDVQWILAAEKSKKNKSPKSIYASHDISRHSPISDKVSDASTTRNRRHASAGKHRQFPWTSQEDMLNSKHPSSAPANAPKTSSTTPPFRPKSTWGPESEDLPPTFKNSSKNHQPNGSSLYESSLSSIEGHNRRKEGFSLTSPTTPSTARDSGYQPSFAAGSFSSPTDDTSSTSSSALSSSCPSSFFEKNSVARPRRSKKSPNDSPRSSARTEDTNSPIRLKPALARSASKRRDSTAASSKELARPDDPAAIPINLKTKSASPRFDQMLFSNSIEQMRPMLKPHHASTSSALSVGTEKFPGPSIGRIGNDTAQSPSPTGYTPTPLLRKVPKDQSVKSEPLLHSFASNSNYDLSRAESLFGNDDSFNRPPGNPPSPRPVASSQFSPSRHRPSEDLPESLVNSIRRSAQNKRERMKSQPCNEQDALNGSFTEFASAPAYSRASTSSLLDDSNDSIASFSRSSDSPSFAPTDTPTLKYNPNAGKTFEGKMVDKDVSVVGVGYPSHNLAIMPSASNADIKSPTSHSSFLVPSTSSGVAVLPNKFSPITSSSDRGKTHRGLLQSALGSSNNSPEPSSRSFNIQGKGVFLISSSNVLSPSGDNGTTSSRDDPYKSGNDYDPDNIIDGICGVAVGQLNELDDFSDENSSPSKQISLSASFREQKERRERRKETFSKSVSKQLSRTLTYGESLSGRTSYGGDSFDDGSSRSSSGDSRAKPFPSTPPQRNSRSGATSKTSSSPSNVLSPLDNPEKSLQRAITSLATADLEDWEMMTQGTYTVRRLATHHPAVLGERFHDVITLLNKHVPSLRSQVSKASVQAVTDLYTNLKKPVVDVDIDATVRTLLLEHGKQKIFIKNELSKALQAIMSVATTGKTLNALISTGLKHKNPNVRETSAMFCQQLVDKMGPGKALSGIKDTTGRLLEALGAFVSDSSQEVRGYARQIVNALMNHEDFSRSLDRYLSANSAQAVKNVASSIRQKGLNPSSSLAPKKSGGSGRKRTSSSPTPATSDRFLSSSANLRGKGKAFNEQDHENLKSLCNGLSEGDLNEKKNAVDRLLEKVRQDKRFVEENIIKIMSAYLTLLTTAQTKLNSIGLEHLPQLISALHSNFRDVAAQLIPAVLKLTTSKQHGYQALQVIDLLVERVDHTWIIQPFATSAMYHGNAKAKQTSISTITKLIPSVARRKPQIVERQVLPVMWSLLSSQNAHSGAQLRREINELAGTLHRVLGRRLLECADAQNMTKKLKDVLDA